MRRAAAIVLACCGGSAPPAPNPGGPPAAFVAVPTPGDVQVATVDGRPVWGGCVADQLARSPALTRRQALDQCVELELLAGAADRAQLAADREVVEATHTALVRRLVDAFEAKYPNPDSLRAQIDEMFAKAGSATRPELRASFHVLVAVPKTASAEVDAAARRTAEQIYQQLANEPGRFPQDLRDVAARFAAPAGTTLEVGDVPRMTRDNRRNAPEYVGALFALPEVGRVSSVVRTKEFGYHIILMTELQPATPIERDQVFAGLRRQLFLQYVAELMKGARPEIYPERLGPEQEAAP